MNKRTVWLVESGSYSDYSIIAVMEDEVSAKAYAENLATYTHIGADGRKAWSDNLHWRGNDLYATFHFLKVDGEDDEYTAHTDYAVREMEVETWPPKGE